MGKIVAGAACTVVLLAVLLFGLGVFEEAQDGPIEEAAESVEEAVE